MSRPTEAPRVPITWRGPDPSPAQLAAWEGVWRWLLAPQGDDVRRKAAPPAGEQGASTDSAVGSGRHVWGTHDECSTSPKLKPHDRPSPLPPLRHRWHAR